MHNHWAQHLNVRGMILEQKPKKIVEVGAGNGDNTVLLASLHEIYPFELYAISDKEIPGISGVNWMVGLSYKRLKEFPDNSLDMVIIDTDHNYWTLMQELEAVKDKLVEGGLILFHDVEEFYHNTGMAMSYWDGEPYPKDEIAACIKLGGTGDALLQFLVDKKAEYKLVRWVPEKYGAAVIQKRTVATTFVIQPAGAPPFAKPYIPDNGEPVAV